ncbi:hypothetical protein B7463_g9436, partial [Scytalidium lignicola]
MKPIFLAILLPPLLRQSPTILVRAAQVQVQVQALRNIHRATFSIPQALEYPSCNSRRNFSSTFPAAAGGAAASPSELLPDAPETPRQYTMADTESKDKVKGADECPEELAAAAAAAKAEETRKKTEDIEEESLPRLSAADFRTYNSMAEHMEYFHNHFRHTWDLMYKSCVDHRRPQGISLKQFINMGLQFVSHLTLHHSVEEEHIFPVLARKMPEFKAGKNRAELLRQHDEIHKGLHDFEDYLTKCLKKETELDLNVLKEQMDTWGDVLWKHLDQEVKTLGAANMRKHWTLDEMKRMPF